MRFVIVTALQFISTLVFSQCLVPFTDFSNNVYLFDSGEEKYMENLPLRSYKVGRNNMFAYVAQNTHTKLYYKGKTVNLEDFPVNYYMTDNWFLYQNFTVIKLLYKDNFITLESSFAAGQDSLYYSDSVVVWQNSLGELNAFYNGQTQLLERTPIRKGKIGPNIFAYMDAAGNFKVFYQGQLQTIETYEPANYIVNQDIVMYIDQYGNYKYFADGQLEETDVPNQSNEYRVGKDFAVYISNMRQFVVRYKGEETTLMEDHPVKYTVRKNMLVWTDQGNNFNAWYNGKTYLLERYIPLSYKMDNDIVIYQDLDGRLQGFYFGEQVQVSDQIVNTYELFNEAVKYSLQPYETKIWCDKKTYTFK